jgi:acid stress-induced BolA-like protein IbaG/YrbA
MPRLCDFETCRKQASYGEFYGKPLRCKEHKEEYKLVSQLCQSINCNLAPNFNFEGETKKLYCVSHKLEGMINVKDKRCIYKDCNKQPSYNNSCENNAIYCKNHKLPEKPVISGGMTVSKIDKNTNVVLKIYNSISDAIKENPMSRLSLQTASKNNTGHNGFLWKISGK